jgi:hypothetical protein
MHSFQLTGIDHRPFEPLFELDDVRLAQMNIVRRIADASPGFPCRVSLEDAAPGEEVLLLNYTHHDVRSPYRGSGPIYVRRGARRCVLPPGVVPGHHPPPDLAARLRRAGMMVCAKSCRERTSLPRSDILDDGEVAYIHLHNARRLFLLPVDRLS